MARPKPFEVHEHCYISGPRANGGCYDRSGKWQIGKFSHSHEGGSVPHKHPQTGPSVYTIDKDDWFRSTGLRGGGRKKFTAKPTGEQLPWKELEHWQKSFQIIIGPRTPETRGEGPGIALPARMVLTFGMTFEIKETN
jgi:hypothetical protein